MSRFLHGSGASSRWLVLAGLALLLTATLLIGLRLGALELSFADIPRILWQRDGGMEYQILANVRLPRVLLGALVGACLAVSGTLLQGVMRNPLASPGIIGVSAGGGLAAVVTMLALPQYGHLMMPAAFTGALATAALVYALAWKRGAGPVRLILAGVAVSTMLSAAGSAIMLFNAERAGGVLDFTVGSLSARGWPQLELAGPYMIVGLAIAMFLGGRLNILALGDEVAAGLGMRVESTRFFLIAVAALLAAAAVCVAGLLGFVGLIAPHMVRMLMGSDNRFLLPASTLFGAALVSGCDTLGRKIMDPSEMPVGLIMAILGPPFFLYLLRKRSYEA